MRAGGVARPSLRRWVFAAAAASALVVASCGSGSGTGRLDANAPDLVQAAAVEPDPGGPVPVLGTTTTAPIVSRTSAPPPPSAAGRGSGTGGTQDPGVAAMLECLRRNGVDVPAPKQGPGGALTLDESFLTLLNTDPRVHEIAQRCAGGQSQS